MNGAKTGRSSRGDKGFQRDGIAQDAGLIKADDSETLSSRYARQLPFKA